MTTSIWDMDPFKLNTTSIGFDKLVKEFQNTAAKTLQTYPPYNIKKTGNDTYVIEMAIAGFGKSDIEITLEDNKLLISGAMNSDEEAEYLHKGIAQRPFSHEFKLADRVEVDSAEMVNGLLRIWLDTLAYQKKTKKINIDSNEGQSKAELLNEKLKREDSAA